MDETEATRRAMIQGTLDQLVVAASRGEQVWDTDEFRLDFELLGFMAPFVVVRRKSHGVRGTLQFTHDPRWHFGWLEE